MKLAYLIAAVLLFAGSFFVHDSLDIAVHDTYFVIAGNHILYMIAFLYFLFALVLWIVAKLGRTLSLVLIRIHFILTSLCFVTLFYLFSLNFSSTTNYSDYSVYDEMENTFDKNYYLTGVVILLLLTQIIFAFTVIQGILKKR